MTNKNNNNRVPIGMTTTITTTSTTISLPLSKEPPIRQIDTIVQQLKANSTSMYYGSENKTAYVKSLGFDFKDMVLSCYFNGKE
jgi:hypothetical protein